MAFLEILHGYYCKHEADCEIDQHDTTAGQSPTGIEPRAGAISTELQELMKS